MTADIKKNIISFRSGIEDILKKYKDRSDVAKCIIRNRFINSPKTMEYIASELHTTKQNIDQVEKKILLECKNLFGDTAVEILSFLDDIFAVGEDDEGIDLIIFARVLVRFYKCSHLGDGVYAKGKVSATSLYNAILLAVKKEGLPLDLTKIKLTDDKIEQGFDKLMKIKHFSSKFSISGNAVYYLKTNAGSSIIGNLSLYLLADTHVGGGLAGIYNTICPVAEKALAEDGITSFDDFMRIISKRSGNLVDGKIFSIDGGIWELSTYFVNLIGEKEIKNIVINSLKIAEEVPCEITSVFLYDTLAARMKLNPLINHYSLKSILIYSGKFKNIKKFKIIPVDKKCKSKNTIKDIIHEILLSGPKSIREIENKLTENGLSYTGTTVGMAVADRNLFDFKYGMYLNVVRKNVDR